MNQEYPYGIHLYGNKFFFGKTQSLYVALLK